MFEPRLQGGPSGLADPPRPFVLRAAHLDGKTVQPAEPFVLDVHVFAIRDPALAYFVLTFAQLAEEGLGPRRGRVELASVCALDERRKPGEKLFDDGAFRVKRDFGPVVLSLAPRAEPVEKLRVTFLTPTELKASGSIGSRPDFSVLFARVRDRVATLRSLYGEGPLETDFRGLAERAARIQTIRSDLRFESVSRRSSRTGTSHGLEGFVGCVDYAGDLREFAPWLRAAEWTGLGRHTVWGNGSIHIVSE